MLADGWQGLAAALVVPLLVVLAIGLHGVGLVLGWLVLTALFWMILGFLVPGRWGRAELFVTSALSSLLAAVVVVSLIGR